MARFGSAAHRPTDRSAILKSTLAQAQRCRHAKFKKGSRPQKRVFYGLKKHKTSLWKLGKLCGEQIWTQMPSLQMKVHCRSHFFTAIAINCGYGCSSFLLHLSSEMIMTKLKLCRVVVEQALEEVWTIMQLQTHALLQRPVWNTMEI